jgi:hexosaminidase
VGGGQGGFYTQEQYRDIVQYAADRFVTIVPEIDMPGHTNAALVSYPELNCRDTVLTPHTGTEVGFSTLCTGSETTYRFVEDVIRELAELTPGPYIHIGGDESHVTPIDDYVKFMNRVQPIVNKYGKNVIGWDEIANATPVPNSVVQFWADVDNSLMAVAKGAKVIMSPAKKTYLDMQYDSTTRLGLHWAAYIEVDSAYDWNPETYVSGILKDNIIGVEAPLWTETVKTMDDIEYMAFPRLPGIAEIGWTPASERKWDEYKYRLAVHARRFNALGIDYYRSPKVMWKE